MDTIKIYHNPRCSKSRQALKILNDKGLKIDIVLYLDNRLKYKELKSIINKLNISPDELLRKNEKIYKEISKNKNIFDKEELINLMIEYPNLIQRPIVEVNGHLIIARPPEKILDIL